MDDSTTFVAYASLVIAVLGGVPGILEFLRFLRERKKFAFDCQCFMNSEVRSGDGIIRRQCLLLSGSVTNRGALPVYPRHFDLYWPSRTKWARLERCLIPTGAQFLPQDQEIELVDPSSKDLQKCSRALIHGEPCYGHLMFFFPVELEWDYKQEPMPPKLKLVCTDTVDRTHTMYVEIRPASPRSATYPHLGVTVTNR